MIWVEFMQRAALAGIGVATAAAVLGSFVLWRRMAYFGDATAHAALLGVAVALGLSVSVFGGVLAVALGMALILSAADGHRLGRDALLGVLSHSALAFGLVAVSVLPGARINIESYLFGDILAVTWGDVAAIWAGSAAVIALIAWRWSRLITATVSPELAWSEGIDPRREALWLTLALAAVVAVAIKVVGALLITAMLILPAAAARALARTPEAMAVLAAGFGSLSVVLGLVASWQFDTPAGPSIVCAAAVLVALTRLVPSR
jgi:zinc transport system permease protein